MPKPANVLYDVHPLVKLTACWGLHGSVRPCVKASDLRCCGRYHCNASRATRSRDFDTAAASVALTTLSKRSNQ